MIKTFIHFLVLFIVMVLVQIVCNNICLFGVAVPLLYIYFIVRLPINISPNWTMTLSFLMGLIVDIFANTQGMHALASTITAACRQTVFGLYFSREDDLADPTPSIRTLGSAIFLKYLFSITLLQCTLLFLIQAFTLHHATITILRIVCSALLSTLLIFGIDSLISSREKRL